MTDYTDLKRRLRFHNPVTFALPDEAADAIETLERRCVEHEQFRHQHRDCDKMGLEIQRLRGLLSAAQPYMRHFDGCYPYVNTEGKWDCSCGLARVRIATLGGAP